MLVDVRSQFLACSGRQVCFLHQGHLIAVRWVFPCGVGRAHRRLARRVEMLVLIASLTGVFLLGDVALTTRRKRSDVK